MRTARTYALREVVWHARQLWHALQFLVRVNLPDSWQYWLLKREVRAGFKRLQRKGVFS